MRINEYLFGLDLHGAFVYAMMSDRIREGGYHMISFVRGPLIQIEEDSIVVETGGIGLEIRVPVSVFAKLPPIGEEVKVYTYFQVREEGMSLYGFLNRQDKVMFRQLLSVNGVGPKVALGILSVLGPDDLRMAVISGDAKAISRAPGIGMKTAQRVILDLKDKITMEQATESWLASAGGEIEGFGKQTAANDLFGAAREAVLALIALGYSNMEATKAVKKVELTENMTTEIGRAHV